MAPAGGLQVTRARRVQARPSGSAAQAYLRASMAAKRKRQLRLGDLSPEALAALEAVAEPVELAGGEILFRQGDPGDAVYVVVRGRLRVLAEDGSRAGFVAEIGPGETAGEMALLTGGPRTATVAAARDSELLRISRPGFEAAYASSPQKLLGVTKELVHRLQRAEREPPVPPAPRTVALLPLTAGAPVRKLAEQLAAAGWAGKAAAVVGSVEAAAHSGAELEAWLDAREQHHHLVLYAADGDVDWTRLCARQADLILLVAEAGHPSSPAVVEAAAARGLDLVRRQLVLLHPGPQIRLPEGGVPGVESHHHVRLDRTGDVARLARRLAGRAVGIAFGGGGARGFAHLGVLRAARELELPVDAVAGTSIGAIIGGLAAMELDLDEIRELCRRWLVEARVLAEKQLPLVSLVRPSRFDRSLRELFGGRRIEELPVPYFCVSANLTQAEIVVHDSGPLAAAVRASGALPGVVPPVLRAGDLLRERHHCAVIASDVSPARDLSVKAEVTEVPPPHRLLWERLRRGRQPVPGILAILVRTVMLGSLQAGHRVRAQADLYLHPPVDELGIFEFEAIDRAIEIGYQHALPRMREWKAARRS